MVVGLVGERGNPRHGGWFALSFFVAFGVAFRRASVLSAHY